nr:SNF-related serine/threonine-protein kinase-like [Anolis sagrei ordinatus]
MSSSSASSSSSSCSPAEGQIAGLYDLEGTLGKGHFAVVRLARHVFTGERVAVKVIDKGKLRGGGAVAQLLQEVRCMKLVQHPNVVRLYEVIDTQAKLYLILELGSGGDMFDHLLRHEGGLGEERAKHYFAQIVHAIAYCHRLHVVHRDLKPENVVFFQEQSVVKLTDFGFSNCFQPGSMLATSCGSLAYSAPEILLGDEYEAPAVDIWSLGVILFMLVCGQPPFQEANDSETLTMILDCRYVIPPSVSSSCADLISRMLRRDPRSRASLEEIEGHPWLRGVDPSPASRSLLPLTSHRRVSQEEHEIILQAMMCGNIAEDRETIQEALEADRYNHITATYFLLAERILREKQEKESRTSNPRLAEDALTQSVQSSEAGPPGKPPQRRFSAATAATGEGPPCSFREQPIRALIRPSLVETPVTKSTLALQQISEEEDDEQEGGEEEEGEGAGLLLLRRRTSSLNQEQISCFQSAKAALLFGRSPAPHGRPAPAFPQPHGSACADPQTQAKEEEGEGAGSSSSKGGHTTEGPKSDPEAPGGCRSGREDSDGGQHQGKGRPLSVKEGKACEAEGGGNPSPAPQPPTPPQDGGGAHGSSEGPSAESASSAKGKGANLKERILQFPLCEKALAFRMRPSPKESLLSLGQFNCCHVI